MNTILIDGYFYDRAYGFGRVVREMHYALENYGRKHKIVLLVDETNYKIASDVGPRVEVVVHKKCSFPFWEQWVVPKVARQKKCNLVHFPYQSTALAWPARKTVATVHDLMFLRSASTSSSLTDKIAHSYRKFLFFSKTRYAQRIVSVSEATAKELIKYFSIPSSTIETSSELFISQNSKVEPHVEKSKYFIHRGGGPHKNTQRIIDALRITNRGSEHAGLVIYGQIDSSQASSYEVSEDVRFVGKVSDAELAAFFKGAIGVLMPSIEEGYGLSIVEAFGFGSAVVTSNKSPMKDIAGNAAILVNPEKTQEIADAMISLLVDPGYRESLVGKGASRYGELFSASQFAVSLEDTYSSI